jgi:protein arginine N-methyltransferase 1
MYTLISYGEMIADRVRMNAYVQAMRRTVKPGSVVLEIGTGPGIFAILACKLGARRVFAIEPAEIIQVARENAAANNCADRIEFMEDLSTRVSLPVKSDVIVSDIRGILPLFEQHIPSIADARRRFLAPGGVMIPRRDTIWAAVAELPERYAEIVEPWERSGLDQDLSAARRRAVNYYQKARTKPEELLTSPQLWATLDYTIIENSDVRGEMRWSAERDGTGHGIIAWFDADLCDGVSFSNAPGKEKTIYGSLFFPWMHPVKLTRGETVCVQLEAKLTGDDYAWRWTTQVKAASPGGETRDQFDQSTMAGAVLSPTQLRKLASDFVPKLSEDGLLDRKIMEMMDGKATLEEIAKQLTAENPKQFPSWHDALVKASALSRKYSR